MITKEDLGPFMFNEKVEQLLKERDESVTKCHQLEEQLKAAEEKAGVYRALGGRPTKATAGKKGI